MRSRSRTVRTSIIDADLPGKKGAGKRKRKAGHECACIDGDGHEIWRCLLKEGVIREEIVARGAADLIERRGPVLRVPSIKSYLTVSIEMGEEVLESKNVSSLFLSTREVDPDRADRSCAHQEEVAV
jgi:hypothetical protein